MKNKISLVFVYFVMLGQIFAQDTRTLHFLHGFGGGSGSWQLYKDNWFVPNFNLISTATTPPSFPTNNGIIAAGAAVNSAIQGVSNPEYSIVIAHSLGGLATRVAERDFGGDDFGGYVMLGTPNGGAPLAKAYRDKRLQAYCEELCEEVVVEPLGSLLGVFRPLLGLGVQAASGILCSGLYQRLESQLSGFTAPGTTADLVPGNPTLNSLNAFQSEKPRAIIYGSEQTPINWRIITSLTINKPSTLPFHKLQDDDLVHIMSTAESVERVVAVAGTVAAALYALRLNIPMALLCGNMAVQFWQGVKTLQESDPKWSNMVGAGGFFSNTTIQNVFTCQEEFEELFTLYETNQITFEEYIRRRNILYCNPRCFEIIPVTTTNYDEGDHDGVVPEYSVRLPGVPAFEAKEVNHQELMNHPNTTKRFEDIFMRGSAGDFFILK